MCGPPKSFKQSWGIFFGYIGHILDEHSLLQLLWVYWDFTLNPHSIIQSCSPIFLPKSCWCLSCFSYDALCCSLCSWLWSKPERGSLLAFLAQFFFCLCTVHFALSVPWPWQPFWCLSGTTCIAFTGMQGGSRTTEWSWIWNSENFRPFGLWMLQAPGRSWSCGTMQLMMHAAQESCQTTVEKDHAWHWLRVSPTPVWAKAGSSSAESNTPTHVARCEQLSRCLVFNWLFFWSMIYPSLAATFPSKSSRLGFHQGGIMRGHRSLGSRQVRKGYTNCFLEQSFDLDWLLNKITAFLWSWYVGSLLSILNQWFVRMVSR